VASYDLRVCRARSVLGNRPADEAVRSRLMGVSGGRAESCWPSCSGASRPDASGNLRRRLPMCWASRPAVGPARLAASPRSPPDSAVRRRKLRPPQSFHPPFPLRLVYPYDAIRRTPRASERSLFTALAAGHNALALQKLLQAHATLFKALGVLYSYVAIVPGLPPVAGFLLLTSGVG
jgi:hypothetical protein